jgi:hypothetical protein
MSWRVLAVLPPTPPVRVFPDSSAKTTQRKKQRKNNTKRTTHQVAVSDFFFSGFSFPFLDAGGGLFPFRPYWGIELVGEQAFWLW